MAKDLWCVLKLEFTRLLGINKARFGKSKGEKAKTVGALVGLAFIAVLFLGLSTIYGYLFLMAYQESGQSHLALMLMVVMASIVMLFTSLHSASSTIFGGKDYELLSSMPIKRSAIITAKLIYVYIENLVFFVILVLPVTVLYGVIIKPSVWFYLRSAVGFVFGPAIPVAISMMLGTFISVITSRWKKTNLLQIVLYVAVMVLYALFMTSENMSDDLKLLTDISKTLSKVYPLAEFYAEGVVLGKLLPLTIYVFASVGSIGVFIAVVSSFYVKINTLIMTKRTGSKYKEKTIKKSSVFGSLLKREAKRLFSSAVYLLNGCGGIIMLIVFSVLIAIKGGSLIESYQSAGVESYEEIKVIFKYLIVALPILPILFTGINSLTACSISIEGKTVWILKTLPIDVKKLFYAKILLSVIINGVASLISVLLIGVAIKASVVDIIFAFVVVALYCVFNAQFGLILNLKFQNYNWQNEADVVKRGTPVAISTFVGIFSLFFFVALFVGGSLLATVLSISPKYLCWGITAVLLGVGVYLFDLWIKTRGVKAFFKSE